MKTIFVGPSHIVRLEHCFKYSHLLPYDENFRFIGIPASPIWSDKFPPLLNLNYCYGDRIILFINDFRFGNSITKEDNFNINKESPFIASNFTGINKNLINITNDVELFLQSIYAINQIINKYEGTELFFYDLIFRLFFNQNSNYIPLINFQKLSQYYNKNAIIIDDPQYINTPEYDFSRLVVDSCLHPSNLGYVFIYNILIANKSKHKSISGSFRAALAYIQRIVYNQFQYFKKIRNITFIGNSVFLKTLLNDTSRNSSESEFLLKLNKSFNVNIIFNSDSDITKDLIDNKTNFNLLQHNRNQSNKIIIVSDDIVSYEEYINISAQICTSNILLIPYNLLIDKILTLRNSKSTYKPLLSDDEFCNLCCRLKIDSKIFLYDGLIHIGPQGTPYPLCYRALFNIVSNNL